MHNSPPVPNDSPIVGADLCVCPETNGKQTTDEQITDEKTNGERFVGEHIGSPLHILVQMG